MTLIEPSVELVWATPDALLQIEHAGRTCYKSEDLITPASATDFVKKLDRLGHHSVLEHASASFRIVCDRGISHELVRHRLASFSQESSRYCNYTKDKHGGGDIKFIAPLCCASSPEKLAFAEHAYRLEQDIYNDAIAMGFTPQEARDFLPTGVKTELVMTANLREWRLIMKLRTDKAAHPKMRVVANKINEILTGLYPALFAVTP